MPPGLIGLLRVCPSERKTRSEVSQRPSLWGTDARQQDFGTSSLKVLKGRMDMHTGMPMG